jgi:hypothetical protein
MKVLKLIVIGMALFLATTAKSQVAVSVNIGSPPLWGPIGYTEAHYYYLPDVEAYYDVPSSMFIYYDGGTWVHRAYLPARYRNYDLYGGYKVVMTDYHGNAPYTNFIEYKKKYAKGYRGQSQKNIGEKPGKGNSNSKMSSKDNSNKKVSQGNSKSVEHGHGGGNGKKK